MPITVSMYLEQQGTEVPGTAVSRTLNTAGEVGNLSFSQVLDVTAAPVTLEVVGQGTGYLYGPVSITVNRLGDSDSTTTS